MALLTNNILSLKGKSGKAYEFKPYTLDHNFSSNSGGVYVFTKRYEKIPGKMSHVLIYVGRTNDLSKRFDDHHKANCIKQKGANCICVLQNENEMERVSIETDILKEKSDYPCNEIND